MNRILIFLFGVVVAVVSRQSGAAEITGPSGSSFTLSEQESTLLAKRLQGADRPRLSIAMSGGGIRSSLFNIGVLKALYDQGVLDNADVISSVSGGSYTTYWLYTNEMASPQKRFGFRAFENQHFPQRVCELITKGNFVTMPKMVGYFFTGFGSSRAMYQRALVRTYGDMDTKSPVLMKDLAPLVSSGNAPYLIVNTSTRGGDEKSLPWSKRLYEFTPLHYGNSERGLSLWNGRGHELQRAAVTSGAALAVLNHKFYQPFPESSENEFVKLYDGGKTENLGAVAPLLRGTNKLIVIDAQLDSEKAPFGAYFKLKENLEALKIELQIPSIERDRFQPTSRFKGQAKAAAFTTDIDYIKMRIPASLRTTMENADAKTIEDGEKFKKLYYDTLDANRVDGDWDCNSVANLKGDFRNWLLVDTSEYIKFSEGKGIYRKLTRALPDRQAFPEHSTIDQSFYLDQAIAYIGLGYMVTMNEAAASEQ